MGKESTPEARPASPAQPYGRTDRNAVDQKCEATVGIGLFLVIADTMAVNSTAHTAKNTNAPWLVP